MIYTMYGWKRDGSFRADPGQEVEEGIYNRMLDVMPPLSLPREAVKHVLDSFGIGIHGGFLMGEAVRHEDGKPVYHAFGDAGGKYFYLGLFPEAEPKTETFYYLECGNAIAEGLYPATDFDGDADAIRTAADYEATLYKVEYVDGVRTGAAVLYDPRDQE